MSTSVPFNAQTHHHHYSSSTTAPTSAPTSHPHPPHIHTQPPPNHHLSDPDGTAPYLREFNLLAEAAKRAQMAVLMRDMEAMGVQ